MKFFKISASQFFSKTKENGKSTTTHRSIQGTFLELKIFFWEILYPFTIGTPCIYVLLICEWCECKRFERASESLLSSFSFLRCNFHLNTTRERTRERHDIFLWWWRPDAELPPAAVTPLFSLSLFPSPLSFHPSSLLSCTTSAQFLHTRYFSVRQPPCFIATTFSREFTCSAKARRELRRS